MNTHTHTHTRARARIYIHNSRSYLVSTMEQHTANRTRHTHGTRTAQPRDCIQRHPEARRVDSVRRGRYVIQRYQDRCRSSTGLCLARLCLGFLLSTPHSLAPAAAQRLSNRQ